MNILPEVISFAFFERIFLEPFRSTAEGGDACGKLQGLQGSAIIGLESELLKLSVLKLVVIDVKNVNFTSTSVNFQSSGNMFV